MTTINTQTQVARPLFGSSTQDYALNNWMGSGLSSSDWMGALMQNVNSIGTPNQDVYSPLYQQPALPVATYHQHWFKGLVKGVLGAIASVKVAEYLMTRFMGKTNPIIKFAAGLLGFALGRNFSLANLPVLNKFAGHGHRVNAVA